ncbi:hypothetical protein CPB83DRAFT_517750 [Crepidotus variabilis]|uniref:Uncharacterized protein n=1 Tax=Crepidotus variabilis TaxID=179855 RepID=A0A9P6EAF3_9AGAR|nr:hypothetical protein CPB83DRAFT_517750 [Crepidotus variabilis]
MTDDRYIWWGISALVRKAWLSTLALLWEQLLTFDSVVAPGTEGSKNLIVRIFELLTYQAANSADQNGPNKRPRIKPSIRDPWALAKSQPYSLICVSQKALGASYAGDVVIPVLRRPSRNNLRVGRVDMSLAT